MRRPEVRAGAPAFAIDLRVYYADTDAGGVMYHANYLNFFERARTEWLRHLGFELPPMAHAGCMFIVRRMQLRFVRPALLDDLVHVSAQPVLLGRAQITVLQRVQRSAELLVEASVNLACVNPRSLRPTVLPVPLHTRLEKDVRTASEQEEQA